MPCGTVGERRSTWSEPTEHENMQTPHRQATAEGGVKLKTLLRGLNLPLCHLAVLIIIIIFF